MKYSPWTGTPCTMRDLRAISARAFAAQWFQHFQLGSLPYLPCYAAAGSQLQVGCFQST